MSLVLRIFLLLVFFESDSSSPPIPESENPQSNIYYKIFVPSFYDSDGDGIGDLNGIAFRLNYLHQLGIHNIILSPIYKINSIDEKAPVDFDSIDQRFGNAEQLKKMIQTAHDLNINVMLTLDLNVTSIHSHWFTESQLHHSPYYQYYNWSDNQNYLENDGWYKPNQSVFNEKYFSSEGKQAASLFIDNDAVRYEIIMGAKKILNESKADGFFVINVNELVTQLPSESEESWWTLFCNFLHREAPGCLLISDSKLNAPPLPYNFFDGYMDTAFQSTLCQAILSEKPDELKSNLIKKTKSDSLFKSFYYLTDEKSGRMSTQFSDSKVRERLATNILFTIPGNIILNYGDELGMNGSVAKNTFNEPFVWNFNKKDQGQTTWKKLVANGRQNINPFSVQLIDSLSEYYYFKKLIDFRNNHNCFIDGSITDSDIWQHQLLAYKVSDEKESLLIIHNMSSTGQQLIMEGNNSLYLKIIWQSGREVFESQNEFFLPPFSSVVLSSNN